MLEHFAIHTCFNYLSSTDCKHGKLCPVSLFSTHISDTIQQIIFTAHHTSTSNRYKICAYIFFIQFQFNNALAKFQNLNLHIKYHNVENQASHSFPFHNGMGIRDICVERCNMEFIIWQNSSSLTCSRFISK